ncbi:MAG: hypothetical protein M1830_005511 [Pleopsidium flavum]|nr:MAG: hypothetical protein M1830_005511 [Pleopsidium flavum]
MASDEDYSSFLEKANQDRGATKASSTSGSAVTKAVDMDVPASLQKVEAYYTSDADEPFEPVSLKWKGKNLPSEHEFKELIDHKADISTLSADEFDPRGVYKAVIASVKEAGGGEVKIFRVHHDKTRAEYFVVSFDSKASKIVGLKAKAVES